MKKAIALILIYLLAITCSYGAVKHKKKHKVKHKSTYSSKKKYAGKKKSTKTVKTTSESINIEEEDGKRKGLATWYGGYFHGRRTANDEVYDMYQFTAAHRTLPFGTKVKVTNPKNNKSIIVRINDRGPFRKKYMIDLSYKAFKTIMDSNDGQVTVVTEILKDKEIKEGSLVPDDTIREEETKEETTQKTTEEAIITVSKN